MNHKSVIQFTSDQVELILLRLELSNIEAKLWLDLDGFFNYSFHNKSNRDLPKKSAHVNWTRIDEVISQIAHDASVVYPESAFSLWYNQQEEYNSYDADRFQNHHRLVGKN